MLTPTQYQCYSRERLWVVMDLKRHYRNIRNELAQPLHIVSISVSVLRCRRCSVSRNSLACLYGTEIHIRWKCGYGQMVGIVQRSFEKSEFGFVAVRARSPMQWNSERFWNGIGVTWHSSRLLCNRQEGSLGFLLIPCLLWLNVDPFRLLTLSFGIAFHLQLMLLSYHPIFLRPYHFLNLSLFFELIEPRAPLLAHGCWGALCKYLNTMLALGQSWEIIAGKWEIIELLKQ